MTETGNFEIATTSSSTFERPFSDSAIVVVSSILIPFTLFGIIANILTILVICRSPKLKSICNQIILSLCVSDLMSALISPLFLYRRTWGNDTWAISNFVCKGGWALDFWTSFLTSTHICGFALVRYISVKSIPNYNKLKRFNVKAVIAVLWIFTFICGAVPAYLLTSSIHSKNELNMEYAGLPQCNLKHENVNRFKKYCITTYTIFYYLNFVAIVCFSVGIGRTIMKLRLKRRTNRESCPCVLRIHPPEAKRQKKENQIILQLFLIVASFLIGYIPRTTYHFYALEVSSKTQHNINADWVVGISSYIFLRLSECLNPVFYNLASKKMRTETRRTLGWLRLSIYSCSCRPFPQTPSHENVARAKRNTTQIEASC